MAKNLRSMTGSLVPYEEGGIGPKCLISQVEERARKVVSDDFTPQSLVIGPYNPRGGYNRSEQEKLRLLRTALSIRERNGVKLEAILKEMVGLEHRARSCYADTFDMTTEKFVQMLLLDGYFLLRSFDVVDDGTVKLASATMSYMWVDVVCLVENQIPFFVIEKIYQLITGSSTDVVAVFASNIETWLQNNGYTQDKKLTENEPDPCHILHLLHMYFSLPKSYLDELQPPPEYIPREDGAPPSPPPPPAYIPREDGAPPSPPPPAVEYIPAIEITLGRWRTFLWGWYQRWRRFRWRCHSDRDGAHSDGAMLEYRWHRATEYQMAGINFEKQGVDGKRVNCVLEVRIGGSTVKVPCLTVCDYTCTVLRNLMFLEQHNPSLGSHVTAYCVFLSQIACTAEDVALLTGKGIIDNLLENDSELAKCFANLCREVSLEATDSSSNYLRPIWEAMERRYRNPVYKWMAWPRLMYFRNPWLALGLFAAFTGLMCTVLQTVIAVLGYKKGLN